MEIFVQEVNLLEVKFFEKVVVYAGGFILF